MTQPWKPRPIIYQINTLVWLNTLTHTHQHPITLRNIPAEVINQLASDHVDCVWLMGIWHRGEFCRNSALNYIHEYRAALPDVTPADVAGSAYAIGGYTVDASIGGKRGLEMFRRQLAAHGIKLLLDFVPNHVGRDHPWITDHPEYFLQGTSEILARESSNFYATHDRQGHSLIIAHGRDPHYSGWIDTAQLNVFNADLRQAVIETLSEIATMCDGVRCDMAMLLTDHVFQRTWGWLGIHPLAQPYWPQVIGALKQQYPNFLFIAEVYWGMESEMLKEGFDYTYDKSLYDHAVNHHYEWIYHHLEADLHYLSHNIRFIENHDEPRAAATLGVERSKVFAALICTIPGAVLLHDGQFVGWRIKLPVQITRQPEEARDETLLAFYQTLLAEVSQPLYQQGTWTLFPRSHAHSGRHHSHVLAYGWQQGDTLRLILLNMGEDQVQAVVDVTAWRDVLAQYSVQATNVMQSDTREWRGDDLLADGLYVDLAPLHIGIYQLERVRQPHAEHALP